jgi:hypothetical protein
MLQAEQRSDFLAEELRELGSFLESGHEETKPILAYVLTSLGVDISEALLQDLANGSGRSDQSIFVLGALGRRIGYQAQEYEPLTDPRFFRALLHEVPDELLASKIHILGDLFPDKSLCAISEIIDEHERCGKECQTSMQVFREQWRDSKVSVELAGIVDQPCADHLKILSLIGFLRDTRPEAVSFVIEALKERDKTIILRAIETVRVLGSDDQGLISTLEELAFSEDEELRHEAAFARVDISPSGTTDFIVKVAHIDLPLADRLRHHQVTILLD